MIVEELELILDYCKDYETFSGTVYKMANKFLKDGNYSDYAKLEKAVVFFYGKYETDAIACLRDYLSFMWVYYYHVNAERGTKESNYKNKIIENFNKYFPYYEYIGNEVKVNGVGRIDILAKDLETSRPVLIELKVKNKSPNNQLLSYGSRYNNPILIGVTEQKLSDAQKIKEVKYYTYQELGDMTK